MFLNSVLGSISHHDVSGFQSLTFGGYFHDNRLYAYFEDATMVWRLQLNLSDHLFTEDNHLSSDLI